MKTAGRYFLMTMALMALLSPTEQADTLELKDGRLFEGTYVGGTTSTLHVQIEGRVEVIPIPDVLALTFSSSASATGTIRAPAEKGRFRGYHNKGRSAHRRRRG